MCKIKITSKFNPTHQIEISTERDPTFHGKNKQIINAIE